MKPPVMVLPRQSLPGEIVAQALLVLQLDAGPLCEQPAHLVVITVRGSRDWTGLR